MNQNRYFEINLKNKTTDFSSEFYLIQDSEDFLLAEDFSGNKIILKNSLIYLYIHDAPDNYEYFKLFDNLEQFYANTKFYDELEHSRRYDKIVEDYKEFDENYIPEKKVLISTFIKNLGFKRLNPIYKEGSYYNVTMALRENSITRDEFETFRFLPE